MNENNQKNNQENNQESIFSLLKSIELHVIKLENKILKLENKIDNLNRIRQPPYHPDLPQFPPYISNKPINHW